MDIELLRKKLLAAARVDQPAETVPYAFEQRVIARLRARRPVDVWEQLAVGFWRAAASYVGVVVLLAAWSLFAPPAGVPEADVATDFEVTVLAAAQEDADLE